MSIKIGDVVLRNIQEQVEKNKNDIAAWTTLDAFGIKVLGIVATDADIPEGTYEYGDAYLVGTEEPYDIYVYTRGTNTFVDIGPLTIVGPQGPQGEQGLAGTITIGSVSTGDPGSLASVQNVGTTQNAILNFVIPRGATGQQGPAGERGLTGETGSVGPVGPQGPEGDPGESFMIVGVITNTSQLPDPTTTQRNYAYVYNDGDASTPDRLYYIIGDPGEETWTYSSLAAAGTTVSVNNNPVSTFDADTKQDVLTTSAVSDGTITKAIGFDSSNNLVKGTVGGGGSKYVHYIYMYGINDSDIRFNICITLITTDSSAYTTSNVKDKIKAIVQNGGYIGASGYITSGTRYVAEMIGWASVAQELRIYSSYPSTQYVNITPLAVYVVEDNVVSF